MSNFLLVFLFSFSVLPYSQGEEIKFKMHLREDAHTLDWNYGEVNHEIIYQLMNGLFRIDNFGNPVQDAAKEFQFNAAKTQVDIKLASDRTWSDGKPLCAQHYIDSWQRLKSKELASPYAHFSRFIKAMSSTHCHQLKIVFTQPTHGALARLAHFVFFPIRLDVLKKNPKMFINGKGLVTNGRFVLHSWDLDQKITLKRNPDFLKENKRAIDTIDILFIKNDVTAVALFKKDKLDFIKDIPSANRAEFRGSGALRIFPTLTAYYFGINSANSKVLTHKKVRRALSLSLDRGVLPRILGEEVHGLDRWLLHEMHIDMLPQPRLSAQELIEVRDSLKNEQPSVVLRVYNKPAHRLLAQWAQAQWFKKLGLKIEIEVVEERQYWQEIAQKTPPIFLSGVTAAYNHADAFLEEFLAGSSANWTNWRSKKFDTLVAEGQSAQAESLLLEESYVIPLYRRGVACLIQKKWQNLYVNPMNSFDLSKVTLAK